MTTKADTDKRAMDRVHANHRDMVMTWDEIQDELIWDAYDPDGPEHQAIVPERLEEFCKRFPHFAERMRWFVERWNQPDPILSDAELAAIEVKPEETERTRRYAFWCIRFYDKLRNVEQEKTTLRLALEESVKLQSHYAELLNMHDGGKRRMFTVESWLARLAKRGEK